MQNASFIQEDGNLVMFLKGMEAPDSTPIFLNGPKYEISWPGISKEHVWSLYPGRSPYEAAAVNRIL